MRWNKKVSIRLRRQLSHGGDANNQTEAGVREFQAVSGNGLMGVRDGKHLQGGNWNYISGQIRIAKEEETELRKQAEVYASEGKTPLFFAEDGKILGMVAVADVMKEDSPEAIAELKNMGIHVVMLTGDNEQTAQAIGKQAGVDEVIAGVLPDGKEAVIANLQKKGKVAMVGDGVNDAPALTRADMGIAIGAGTDIAIDAADVVLMKSRLSDVPAAIRLSRATLRNIHENLFWAFIYNIIGIPLAARCVGSFIWLDIESDVRCSSDESVKLLCCDQCTSSESVQIRKEAAGDSIGEVDILYKFM